MASILVKARFNESKHQMTVEVELVNGVKPPINPFGFEFTLMFKDLTATFNQQSVYGWFRRVVDYIRDYNVLNAIQAGDFAGATHVVINIDRDGVLQTYSVADFDVWTPALVDSVAVCLPVESGWVKDGSTIYLDNTAKRMYEKFLEDFGKKV
jgi:hypothetical protein